jgi:hypothetical protein
LYYFLQSITNFMKEIFVGYFLTVKMPIYEYATVYAVQPHTNGLYCIILLEGINERERRERNKIEKREKRERREKKERERNEQRHISFVNEHKEMKKRMRKK